LPVFGQKAYRYRDDRIKAALLLTPAGFDFYRADGIAAVDAPVLVVGAERDETTPYNKFHKGTFDALTGARYMLDLKNAGHLTATDVCAVIDSIGFLARAVGGKQASDGCGAGYLSPDDALDQVVEVALPFFDLYLKKEQAAEGQLHAALRLRAAGHSG
jgi:predicted dienelactone hydrolase